VKPLRRVKEQIRVGEKEKGRAYITASTLQYLDLRMTMIIGATTLVAG
jgi:hypothetical protein